MDKLVIVGGNKLCGEVRISGAKNASLPIMAAALLANGKCVIHNVPELDDVWVMLALLEELGVKAAFRGGVLRLDTTHAEPLTPDRELLGRIRASNLLLGSLVGRFGEAEVAASGGCSIGARPLDLHFAALQRMGVRFLPTPEGHLAFCRELRGADITLAFPSVGATENVLMAAALAEGRTVLHNAAAEPEIADLAGFINAMGGRISGAGTDTIIIDGVKKLGGAEYTVMPDRIETGTFLLAGAMCGGSVVLRGARPEHNGALLAVLRQAGAGLACGADFIAVRGGGRLQSLDVATAPYPGFPTDMQPQLAAMLCLADGCSHVCETVFENRFRYIDELKKMGASIQVSGNCAIIKGTSGLSGAEVTACDLRAGAALVLAGLAASGRTIVERADLIDRGYEDLTAKLGSLGADIRRIAAGAGRERIS
ncbi:MAG: UDP-N-acetylglucosamine 1-carboxyvinyltransferase [Firmicutes bacterium]|nr:UDP-N-acetylglucosamine 1-carboxyvinyltransferase [Bacillota bacterium]